MVVGNSTFISDATLFIRNLLLNTITDPIAASRPSGSKFVATSYHEREVRYPMITVISDNVSLTRDGMRSEGGQGNINFEIRVWARNVVERDTLSDSVIDCLRTKQTDSSTGSIANNLFGLNIGSAVNVDEPGPNGIHSKVLSISYQLFIEG